MYVATLIMQVLLQFYVLDASNWHFEVHKSVNNQSYIHTTYVHQNTTYNYYNYSHADNICFK